MRSAAYNVLTTMLLLVPISAVPLMAIFGVPQFVPVVASPLDESEEDDDWDRPARKKPKPLARADALDDLELDIPAEETLEWDEKPKVRPRPLRKPRPTTRFGAEDAELSAREPAVASDPPQTSNADRRTPHSDPLIRTVANEVVERDPAFVDRVFDEPEPESLAADLAETPPSFAPSGEIPSYRRKRASPRDDSERPEEKPFLRTRRSVPSAEPLTWKKAVARLNELGIRNFRLTPGENPGEFIFTCSYTPSDSPHVTRRFEAEADDPLKAVAKVLAQVQEASQQRILAAPRRTSENRDTE